MKDLSTHVRGLQMASGINLDKAKRMLVRDEGSHPYPYDDSSGKYVYGVGKITIGVGRNLEANPLTDLVIDIILLEDINRAEQGARRVIGNSNFQALSENRKLAVLNLVFNLGEAGFAKFTSTIACIKSQDWHGARLNLLKSKYATQVKGRSLRVADMLEKDVFPYE